MLPPVHREPMFATQVSAEHPAARRWTYSQRAGAEICATLKQAIHADENIQSKVLTIAASGSLGRMELAAHSDCDLLVVLHQKHPIEVRQQIVTYLWRHLARHGWKPPGSTGIYSSAAVTPELVDVATLGQLDESRTTFGQRIQVLLDCQPVYNPDEFATLQRDVANRYAAAQCRGYLRNELIAYYRWLLNWHSHRDLKTPWKWRLRQVKLGHSRAIMHAGLLLHTLQWEAAPESAGFLKALQLTPLERVLELASGALRDEILQRYGFYLQQLETHASDGCQQDFAALTENSTKLRNALFAVARACSAGDALAPAFM